MTESAGTWSAEEIGSAADWGIVCNSLELLQTGESSAVVRICGELKKSSAEVVFGCKS